MALLFDSWWSELLFTVFCGFLLWYLYFKTISSQHWKKYNIPHLEPNFIIGNLWRSSFFENASIVVANLYYKWKHEKLMGMWSFTRPTILINDLDLIKQILTTDFNHFRDRMLEFDQSHDPLSGHLFNITGAKWRNLRVKLTPTFTSGKIKMMLPTMLECGEELQKYLLQVSGGEDVEVKDILARFTTDIISSCAFGIKTNSLENPNSEFRVFGRKIFEPNVMFIIRGLLFNFSPALVSFFKVKFMATDVSNFFLDAIKKTMDYREENNVRRHDFMDLLIQLKNKGKLDDVDGSHSESLEEHSSLNEMKFSFTEAAAQAFVFFLGGFETSSTTLTFALYELAQNLEVQNKLQQKIDEMLEENEMKITYDGIQGIEYLDYVIEETLRKYPPLGFLFRFCTKDYPLPAMKAEIPKGTMVLIPTYGIQRDPDFFPDPEKFDPDRFLPEEKAKRHHYSYLPFGEGPRNCIGNRFGLLQIKTGLISILSKFTVGTCEKTPIPLKYNKVSFVLSSESPVVLTFQRRTH